MSHLFNREMVGRHAYINLFLLARGGWGGFLTAGANSNKRVSEPAALGKRHPIKNSLYPGGHAAGRRPPVPPWNLSSFACSGWLSISIINSTIDMCSPGANQTNVVPPTTAELMIGTDHLVLTCWRRWIPRLLYQSCYQKSKSKWSIGIIHMYYCNNSPKWPGCYLTICFHTLITLK